MEGSQLTCKAPPFSTHHARFFRPVAFGFPARGKSAFAFSAKRSSLAFGADKSKAHMPDLSFQEALSFAHRARAAVEAASLRCCSVMLAARRLPPILPPLRPIWAMSCDTTDLVNLGRVSGLSAGLSPVSILTAMMPAWNSSSGSLRERFRIHFQLGTVRRLESTPSKSKVAHYPGPRCDRPV